jgi:hypothetical protein
MAAVSGQNNFYGVLLHNDIVDFPLENIQIRTDRTRLEGNYITLGVYRWCKRPEALERVSKFVHERLENLGAELVMSCTLYCADVPIDNVRVPSFVVVRDYKKARAVINDLFKQEQMSADDRSTIEDPLRELEKSGKFASEQTDKITVAQKDCILTMIAPYVEEIKKEKPNEDTAQLWIRFAVDAFKRANSITPDVLIKPEVVHDFLQDKACHSALNKSDLFYESLLALAKIYCFMGDLEPTLKQLGPTLPSAAIIQQIILDAFRENPANPKSSTDDCKTTSKKT